MTRPSFGREPTPELESPISRRAVLGVLASAPLARLAFAVPPDPEPSAPPAPPAETPAPAVVPPPAPPVRFFSWREIASGVFVAMAPDGSTGLGANSVLVLGKDESLLLDTKFAAVGAVLRRDCESFGRPLKRVFASHHHTDHTGGNLAFTHDIPVVGHAKCKPRVMEQLQRYLDGLDPTIAEIGKVAGEAAKVVGAEAGQLKAKAAELKAEQFAPTQTIDADANLEMGGVKVQVRHFGPAHTDNDLAVFLPDLNVLHTGDLLFHGYHAHLDKPGGGSSAGWIATLDKMVAMCNDKTLVVPGYGEPTNVDALKRQASYLAAVKAMVEEQVKAGKPREEVVKLPPPADYEKYGLPSLYAITLGGMFDEVEKK